MSDYSIDDKPRFPMLALVVGLVWVALLGVLWYARPGEGETAGDLWIFFGRFHPLVVHLPIGLLLIVPFLEFFGRSPRRAALRESVPTVLWLVALSAVAATVLGYLLMTGEPDDSFLMERHLWTGLIFGALAIVTLILRLRGEGFLYLASLAAALVAVSAAGHYGGALVHGPNYLAKHAPEPLKPLMMFGMGEPKAEAADPVAEVDPDGAGDAPDQDAPLLDRVVFTDFVLPIMEAKCTECHNENKSKGKLRLDSHEFMMAGAEGADYPNVAPGDSEGSELIYRMVLPSDDDDFMPPDGKDPLTPEELAVVRWWIDSGARAEATVADLQADEAMTATLLAVGAALKGDAEAAAAIAGSGGAVSEWDLLSPEDKEARMGEVMAAADHFNFSVMPISAEDDRLKVNVVNASKEFGDEQLATLAPVAERVVWLDIGRSQVSDAGMKTVAKMRNLERLHLENTAVTDAGLAHLTGLTKLEYLNLYGTEVTSAIFEPLANARSLRKLYLWQTKVDPAAARAFQRSMSLEVNIGTELTVVKPEPPAPAEPEKTAEPPKKPETPPVAAKPAPAPTAPTAEKVQPKAEAPKPPVAAKKVEPEKKPTPAVAAKPNPDAQPKVETPPKQAPKPAAKPAPSPAEKQPEATPAPAETPAKPKA